MPPKKTVPTIANRLSATPAADKIMRMRKATPQTSPMTGVALKPATPPPGFNQNTAARHTYGFGAGGPGQGNANLLNEVLARHGINSDLSVQPRQNLDAAAQLQGRLTASGAPFTRPTHQSFNVDGQPAPFVNPFGTTAQKMERGAGSGTLRGGSTVTVDDSGRAVVRGTDTYGPRGLAKFGIVDKPDLSKISQSEVDRLNAEGRSDEIPMKRDYSGQTARLAANRNRMENVLASRRLGVENPLPSAPIPVGTAPEDVLAALSTQQDNSGRLQNMLSLRNQGDTGWRQGTPQAELNRQQFDKQQQLAQSQQQQAQKLALTKDLIGTFAQQLADKSMTWDDIAALTNQVMGTQVGGSSPMGSPGSFADSTIPVSKVETSTQALSSQLPEQVVQDIQGVNSLEELYPILQQNGIDPNSAAWQNAEDVVLGKMSPAEQLRQRQGTQLPKPGSLARPGGGLSGVVPPRPNVPMAGRKGISYSSPGFWAGEY